MTVECCPHILHIYAEVVGIRVEGLVPKNSEIREVGGIDYHQDKHYKERLMLELL